MYNWHSTIQHIQILEITIKQHIEHMKYILFLFYVFEGKHNKINCIHQMLTEKKLLQTLQQDGSVLQLTAFLIKDTSHVKYCKIWSNSCVITAQNSNKNILGYS